jgi:hypothetical protein
MEDEAEREIKQRPHHQRDDVVGRPPTGIGGAPGSERRLSVIRS